jgi:hypothetical protein
MSNAKVLTVPELETQGFKKLCNWRSGGKRRIILALIVFGDNGQL